LPWTSKTLPLNKLGTTHKHFTPTAPPALKAPHSPVVSSEVLIARGDLPHAPTRTFNLHFMVMTLQRVCFYNTLEQARLIARCHIKNSFSAFNAPGHCHPVIISLLLRTRKEKK